MKYKKILLAAMILLAILTISAVSAEESNASENDTLTTPAEDADVLTDDEKMDFDYDAEIPDAIYEYDDYSEISISIPWEHDGNVSVLIDDTQKYNENTSTYYDTPYPVNLLTLFEGVNYGKHSIVINYFGDSYFKNFTYSKNITYDFIKFHAPQTVMKGGSNEFRITVPETVEGSLTLYINSKVYETSEIDAGDASVYYDPTAYTKNTYKLEFKDKNGKYPKRSVSGSFDTTFYFKVDSSEDEYDVGESALFEIYLPSDASGYVEITYNGKTKKVKVTEDTTYAKISDLKLGNNTIQFKYTYDKKTRTITQYVEVNPIIRINSEVRYNSDDGFYLKIPADANGGVNVYVDGVKIPATIKDGELKVILSGFDIKSSHELIYNYTGDDFELRGSNETYEFMIVPYIHYPKHAWTGGDIETFIEMPEDGNGTFTLYVHGELLSSVPVINGTAKITIPKGKLHYDDNWVDFYYTGNYNSPDATDEYIVGHDYPNNATLDIECYDTLIKGKYNYIHPNLPWDAEGELLVYLNGEKIYSEIIGDSIEVSEFLENLDYGTYNFTFKYTGDSYYQESSQSKLLNVSFYRLISSEVITIGENDGFYIELAPGAEKTAKLYINGKLYQTGEFREHDGETYWVSIDFDLSELPCGEYNDVKLVYAGITKDMKFNVTYAATIEDYESTYKGDYAELNVTFGVNLTGNASIVVDGKTYTSQIKDRVATFKIDSFVGAKNITIRYDGDDRYPATTRVQSAVTITPSIEIPSSTYIEETGKVSLTLPRDAKGNLTVRLIKKIEGEEDEILQNESVELINGTAEVTLMKLNLGEYHIEASYTGDDYDVEDAYEYYGVSPKITAKSICVGEEFKFLFEMPEDAGGILKVYIYGQEPFEQELVNGKANFTLKDLAYGEYYYTVSYTGGKYGSIETDDGTERYFDVMRHYANFTQTIPGELIANNPFKLTFKAQEDLTGDLYVYLGDEGASAYIKNGVATVSIKSALSGNVTVRYQYDGDNKYDEGWGEFTVNVLNPVKLTAKDQTVYYPGAATFKVTAYDSFGKAVGADQAVTFYIDGKKVKTVKTNKNGVASLKISKLPKTYKIKATYKGASITKKLTVKQVLTLKTSKVKKSAKKLVLTATLKKGKTPIKGKIIKFKFNGKTYKAKTNKKGIAKVTIPKKVLIKLKAGKKTTYTATYIKTTVKKTVTVGR